MDKIDNLDYLHLPGSGLEVTFHCFWLGLVPQERSVDDTLWTHKSNVAVSQDPEDKRHHRVQLVLVRFLILFEYRDEECLNGKCLAQGCSEIDAVSMEENKLFLIMIGVFWTNCPGEEEKVGYNTDDSICHQCRSEFFKLYDQDHGDECEGVDDGVERCVLVVAGQSFPLDDYEFVV